MGRAERSSAARGADAESCKTCGGNAPTGEWTRLLHTGVDLNLESLSQSPKNPIIGGRWFNRTRRLFYPAYLLAVIVGYSEAIIANSATVIGLNKLIVIHSGLITAPRRAPIRRYLLAGFEEEASRGGN